MSSLPAPSTLLDRLAWRASHEASREALRAGGRSWSYAELWAGIERFATRLLERGIEPQGRVVIAVPNGPEFFIGFYGALRAGMVAVPVSPASGGERLVRIAARCSAACFVTGDPEVTEAIARAGDRPVLTPFGEPEGDLRGGFPKLDPRALAYLQYTSGSTGEPKGVRITHANALTNIEQMIAGMGITADEIFVSWLPVHHDMGLVLMTMVPFHLGARLVLLPATLRDVRGWLAAIERSRGTFTAAPDFAYRLALRSVGRRASTYDLSSLRVALNAAEPVRGSTLREFEEAFGLERVMVPGYGLAESTVGVSMWPSGTAVKIDARGVPSVGRPFPGVEVTIFDESGPAGADREGEIVVSSDANTDGYWRDPEASAALLTSDGAVRTGDLGYLDEEGDLFVVGRKKNIIIHAGRNIAPREVEELVEGFPYVRASAAVGVDRGTREGEQIYVFAEMRRVRQPERARCRQRVVELTRHLREQMGLGPGRLYLVPPRTIPRTHNGKVRHAELRRRYLDGTLGEGAAWRFPEY